ncbi:Bacterial transcription activator, effector binding domain [Variovorax sp. PBL-H6]|uniref:GyrI-like domain-containing protein n=1 Tax=Variovorax sp. PBL-H6 TaxID=434009 RepID=UPI001316F469|nr:effector binding domain-containing protein [Variovorax sp. PBL-H6]VTU33960.1 Bacterial transcription activator, effector binding domain [Variovorax sp. PBL-H6]
MQPELQRHRGFNIAGLTVRTSNHAEHEQHSARIGKLWTRFFDERVYAVTPNRVNDMRLYGVYSAYESDAHGAFDLTTGVAVSGAPFAVNVEAGDYLVFTGRGQMPQMVLSLWESIWQYFERHPDIHRSYRSDFEAYSGPDQVAIHIGVIRA